MKPQPEAFALGLIGYPLEKSLSPQLHTAALKALNLPGEYRLYPTLPAPEGGPDLANLVNRLRLGELHGLNVTIPHKRTITAYLDRLTPLAKEIGAVNTIYLEDGHAVGDNTDALGFLLDLERLTGLPAHRVGNPPSPGHAIVLGGGGAARAVSFALMSAGWQVDLAARRIEEIQPWVEGLQKKLVFPDRSAGRILSIHLDPESIQSLTADISRYPFVLVVNASSAGMLPNVDTTPWPDGLPLPAGAFIYDLVYKPLETRLIREARAAGCPAANGLGMLVEQAARAFELWTGQQAPRPAMRQAVGLDAEKLLDHGKFDLSERLS